MQLSPIAPLGARTDVPTAPATKQEAAKALMAVPGGIMAVATMTAMPKQVSGQPTSRAELVAGLVAQLSPEQAQMMMVNAIDGAIALAPELAERSDALRQAAAGVAALLAEAAADQTQGPVDSVLTGLLTPIQAAAMPLFEAARVLDPTLEVPKSS